jgi:hypothetical protein
LLFILLAAVSHRIKQHSKQFSSTSHDHRSNKNYFNPRFIKHRSKVMIVVVGPVVNYKINRYIKSALEQDNHRRCSYIDESDCVPNSPGLPRA